MAAFLTRWHARGLEWGAGTSWANHLLSLDSAAGLLIWLTLLYCLLCRTELTKSVVLPELIELSGDESGSVRLAAFETLVNMLDMFDTGKSACAHIFISERLFPSFILLIRSKEWFGIFCSEFYDSSLLMSSMLLLLPSWNLVLLYISIFKT